MDTEPTLFREEQQFRQGSLWGVVGLVAGYEWLRFGRRILSGRSSPWAFFRWLMMGISLPWAVYSAKLTTEVKSNQLRVEFSSSLLQVAHLMSLDELKSHEAVTWRPLRDFGGWGLRSNPWKGWAYNVGGNRGVRVELENGTQVLIGSQRAEELNEALTKASAG
jgi:hypothetical protein